MFKKWFGKKDKEAGKEPTPPPPASEAPPAPTEPPAAKAPPSHPAVPVAPPSPPLAETVPTQAPASSLQPPASDQPPASPKRGAWALLKSGLAKTRAGLKGIFTFRGKLDEETIGKIEAQLYAADFGPEMVGRLVDGEEGIRAAWKARKIEDAEQVVVFLKDHLRTYLTRRPGALARAPSGPTVYLIAGVNGTGKTTSIAKLARKLRAEGGKVILAAGDTFRAAAVEQLRIWSERLGIPIVMGKPQADPASVAFQGAERAIEEGFDYLIVDTAGRLHTQKNLMRELKKIRDVIARKIPGAPHESLLVLDATTGQNALNQAQSFKAEIDVTGIILAKLDGTAKGGIVVTINNRLDIPVKLVGVGEKIEDLEDFSPEKFVEALFEEERQ
jgi:fused signal recognition particle receptor